MDAGETEEERSEPERRPARLADLAWVDDLVRSLAGHIRVRREDRLLILVPNVAHKLNDTALLLLERLLAGESLAEAAAPLDGDAERLGQLADFFCDLRALARGCLGDGAGRRAVETIPFRLPFNSLPILSELAATYRCDLACRFCYAARHRGCRRLGGGEADTDGMKKILRAIAVDAQVPSVSFTGGEPTLRRDLPELIEAAAGLGLRVNLITHAGRIGPEEAQRLAGAGLASAQVSLEAADADLHDKLTGVEGSFKRTLRGVEALRAAELSVHTNTTVSRLNAPRLTELPGFVKSLGLTRFSMNLCIPTGAAGPGSEELWVRYDEIGALVLAVREAAEEAGVRFLWYSPTPLCVFNPVPLGLGNQGCAACDGLLSVSPTGEILPCSSFPLGVGNLLEKDFRKIWSGRRAKRLREKRLAPRLCRGCPDFDLCQGACPLYWSAVGLAELERAAGEHQRSGATIKSSVDNELSTERRTGK